MSAGDAVKREYIRVANAAEKTTISQLVQAHQFFPNISSPWQIAKIDVISNPKLDTQFKVHVNMLTERGCSSSELQEQCGFLSEPRLSVIQNAAKLGMQTQQSTYNAMGYSYEGIYLTRYSDVCLQNAVSKLPPHQTFVRIVVCKYVTGRVTKAIPRSTLTTEFIHPTPGFDCHVPLLAPQKHDNPQTLFDNSQVYLFDIDVYKQPQNYPRQLIPFAVVHFTQGGTYLPELDMDIAAHQDDLAPVSKPLQSLSLDSTALSEADVHRIVEASLLNPKYEFVWKPAHYCVMMNPDLKADYEAKRGELLKKGCSAEETADHWGFYVQNSAARGVLICHYGLHTKQDGYNAMGYNHMGVYLSKHIDVTLQHCLMKPGVDIIRVVLCKYMTGKATKAIPREPGAFEFIKPTPGFDCHECLFTPAWEDPTQSRMDKSMVYLYEHAAGLDQAVPRPRHVLPYAILTFTQHGSTAPTPAGGDPTHIPSLPAAQEECRRASPGLDAKLLGAAAVMEAAKPVMPPETMQRLADNPQLQQLIMQINAKKPAQPFVRTGNPWY